MTKIMPVALYHEVKFNFPNLAMVFSNFPLQFPPDLYIVMVLVPCAMKISNKFSAL